MATAFDEYERVRWDGRAAAYQRSFGPLCAYPAAALLDAALVTAGCRVLDAGTGPGPVAALAVGRGAEVVAVDAEASMLEVVRRQVPAAKVRQAILPDLPFPDGAFDAAVGNFVINHLGDPRAGVAELARVVRPGGRIAVTIWPDAEPPQRRPPLQQLWIDIAQAADLQRPATLPWLDTDKNFARTADGLVGLLRNAGLPDARCDTISWVHRTDPEDWWSGSANGIGSLGVMMTGQTPQKITRIRQEYDRLAAAYQTDDGRLALPTAALLAVGTVQ